MSTDLRYYRVTVLCEPVKGRPHYRHFICVEPAIVEPGAWGDIAMKDAEQAAERTKPFGVRYASFKAMSAASIKDGLPFEYKEAKP